MVTVFTSSFNYSKHLREAINSVLNQTYKDFEYHLVDYGSTDDTWDIMQEYASDTRVRVMQIGPQKNKVFAMNHSIREAKGDSWVWCPADDMLRKNMLEKTVEYSKYYPDSVIYSDSYVVDDNNIVIGFKQRHQYTPEKLKEIIWNHSVIGFTGIFIPMSILKAMPFPEDEEYSEDYAWMIEAVIKGVNFISYPDFLVIKRQHSGSCTNREYKTIVSNIRVIHEKLKKKYGIKD